MSWPLADPRHDVQGLQRRGPESVRVYGYLERRDRWANDHRGRVRYVLGERGQDEAGPEPEGTFPSQNGLWPKQGRTGL